MTGRRDHVYRVLAIVIAQECRKPLLLIDKTIVFALLLLSKRTAKPLSVVIRYIFIARKVQPVTVCLRPSPVPILLASNLSKLCGLP